MEPRDTNAAAAPSAFINRRGEDAPQSSEAEPSHALTVALTHYIAHRLRRLSDTRSSGTTAADSSASRDEEKEEAELISAVEAVEMQLLRCLIHVRLDAQEVPSQPELPSDVNLAAGSGDEDEQKEADEGGQKEEEGERLRRSVHARRGSDGQSRASRSPSTAAATTRPIATTTGVVAAANAAAEAASPPPRPPQPRGITRRSSSSSHRQPGGSKARELYYAYTHQNLPPPPPPPSSLSSSKQRQPSTTAAASPQEEGQQQQQRQRTSTAAAAPAPAAGATRAPRSPRHHHRHGGEEEEQQHRRRRRRSSSGDHANPTHSQEPTNTAAAGGDCEDVAQQHQQRTALPPLLKPATTVAHADSSHNSAGGTVRPLTHAELAAALGSWPSRIAQYTLTKQIGKLTVDAIPASPKMKAGELSSLMEEPSSPLSPPSSQPQPCQQQPTHASGEADEEGENVGTAAELHALLRRLRDVLQHTTLPVTTGGEGKQKADVDIIFPTFARFYLAHPSSDAIAGRGDVVQRFLAELTDALVMAAVVPDDADEREEVEEDEESHDTEDDNAAAAVAAVGDRGEAQQQSRTALLPDVVMTGDMVKDVELLLRHTPTVLVSSASFTAVDPSAPPAGTAKATFEAPVFPSAPALIRRVLRRLLRLSPSWHNTTMCTTPLVVGVLRRYSTDTSATNGRLQVRLLPAAEALLVPGMTRDTTSGASPPGRAQGDANTHFFYNALVIEVTGSDAAVGADDDDDAVPLAEEEDVKTRYSADVPESYRRPRTSASPLRESTTAAAAAREHTETQEDASHTPLSRQQCRLWQQLLAMAQFVHVAGTPAQVATTARYVALAIRHRREARQQVQQQQQRQPRITDTAFPAAAAATAPASGSPSIAAAAHAASVPAFFFTLTQTPALTHALDVAMAAATRTLHFDADVREDQHEQEQQQQHRVDAAAGREDAPTRNERDGKRAGAAVVVVQPVSSTPTQPPSQRQGLFSSGPGLGLRALLGWRSNPPPPPPPPTSVATKTLEPTAAATAAPSKAHEAPRRKPLPRTPSPPPPPSPTAVAVAAADDVVMRWMHDVLIPIFYETTVTCSAAEEADGAEGGTTAAASVGGDIHGSSGNSSSGGGRRHRYRLRRQRALLGRVQVVTAAMVHYHLSSDNMDSSTRGAVAGARVISSEGAAPPLAESDLLSYLLLRQLFFDTTTAAAIAASVTAPTRRAHSAPLPQQTALAMNESAGAAGRSSRPSGNGVGTDQLRQQRRALSAAPHSPTRRVQQERRRVSFQDDTPAGTPPRQRVAQGAAADNDDVDTSGMSADATLRRSASPFPSPKSILKSGHRYKAEKLVRSSAPAVSVVPFRSFMLWRWLAAEVWITSCRTAVRHSATTATTAAADLSPALHLTSACYLAEAQAAAVRVASDVVTSLLLSMLQAEQYACYCQLQQRPRTYQTQQQGDVAGGNTMRERRHYTTNNAFRCEDILPLASGVAEAVVRAALAPVVCVAGVPEALQVIVGDKEKKKEEQSASGAAADRNNNNDAGRGETEGSSDESDSDAAASISEGRDGTFLAAADIAHSARHGASSGSIISAFSPALPHDVFQRLHIVSAVCTSRVQHEVLESLARPLQLALRRLARCFARHRQHLLCAPLVDFWKAHGDAVALAEAAVATSSSAAAATIKHYTLAEREAVLRRWAAVEDGLCTRVRRAVELYDDCLVLPRLRSRVGASRAVQLSPGDSEEDDDDDDGAATSLSAPESSSLGADVESSPLPAWTTAQQLRQQQQELQGGDAFVPLCFNDATRYQKTSMSTFVNAPEASASPRGQQQQQQQRQRRLSYPQTPWLNALAVWNPAEVESDTSFDLHSSYGCDWRSLRLSGGASSLAAAASDFAVAVAAATPLQLRPPPALHLTPQTQQQQQHHLHVSVPQQHNYHVPSAFSLSPAISATAASATGNTATTTTSSTAGILLSSSRLVVPNALKSTERYRENDATKNGSPTQPLIANTVAHRTSGATLLSPLWLRLLTPRDGPRLDSVADATSPASFLTITNASVRQQSSPRVPVVTVAGGGASLPARSKHDAQTSAASATPLTQESGEREAQPFVAHLRVGDVVESRLLSPYVEDAKRVLIGAFLCQWVLPRWQLLTLARRTVVQWGEVANEAVKADNVTTTAQTHTTAEAERRVDVAPNTVEDPAIITAAAATPGATVATAESGGSLPGLCGVPTPPAAPADALATDKAAADDVTDITNENPVSSAVTGEKAEMQGVSPAQLDSLQCTVGGIVQACRALALAAQQYELARALEDHDAPPRRPASRQRQQQEQQQQQQQKESYETHGLGSSSDLEGIAHPESTAKPEDGQDERLESQLPTSTQTPDMWPPAVLHGASAAAAAGGKAAGSDAVFGISPPFLASPAVTTPSSPLLPAASQLFVDKTRHERQRILALCQRMFDLIAGRNNGADATDAAAVWTEEDEEKSPRREAMRVFPPSFNTAKENEEKRGRGGHHALKLGPLHTDSVEDTLRLGSLSHGMRGPPCPTPSDESIGSAQPLPRSRRRVSSPASPGPSQLFAPLLAPLRRTSTAYTLTSVPAALLTMQSNTLFSAASTSSAAAAAEEEESGETSLESGALISVPHMPATSPLSREHRPSVEGMTNCLPRVLVAPLSLHRQQQQQQPSVVVVSATSTTKGAESVPRSSTEAWSRNTGSAATARPNQESVAEREQEADDVSGDGATALETVVRAVTGHEEDLDGRAVLLAVPPLPPPLPAVVRVDATQQTPIPPPSTAAAALQNAGTQTLASPTPPTPSMPPKRSDAATSTSALPCGDQRSPRVASSAEQQQQRQRSLSQCSVETAEVTPYKHRSNHHHQQQSRSHDRSRNAASRDGAGEDEQTEVGGDDDTSSTLSPASEHSSNRLTNAIASGRSSPMPSSVSLSSLAAATMNSQDGGPRPENYAAAKTRCDDLDSDDEVMRGGASEEVLSPPAPEVARRISLATESVTPVHAEANDDRSAELEHQHHNDHEVFTSASVREAQSPPAAAAQQQHTTRSALLNAAASTPPRSSAAAVTALADLQQRLGGSNSTVAELRQQLEKATDEARVRDKAMTRLQRRLDVAEAALRRAESSQEAQLERLQLRPPPPLSTTTPVMRSSVAVNTSAEAKATRQPQHTQTQTQLLLSPSVPPTPMKVEVVPQRRESGVQVLLRASSPPLLRVEAATSPVPELAATSTTAAAASQPSRAEAVVNDSGPTTPTEQTFIASQMPADMRIAELEADLRNAAFRMEQWKALLEAERHARAVQVDQLAHQLEREQRRVQRQQSSRSRSRSLSPPDVSAVPMRAGVVVEVPASNQHSVLTGAVEPQASAASTTALLTPPAEELSRREEALQRRVASVVDRLLAAETRLEEQKTQAAQEAAAVAAAHQRECVQLHERVAELEEMLAAERLRERQSEASSAVDAAAAAAAAAAATQAIREKDEALHRLEAAQQQLREELHEEQQQRVGERVQHERELTSLQRAVAAAQHSTEALQDSLRDEEDAHQRTRFEHAAALSTVSAAQVAHRVEVAQLQRGASVWWVATGNLLSTFAHTKAEIVREAAVQVHREAEEKSRNAVAALETAQATLHAELAAARADDAKRDVDLRRELEEEKRNATTTAATQAAAITLQRVQAAQTAQVAQRTREWWETTQACVSAWAESQNRCFVDALECHTRESNEVHASVVAGLRNTIALQAAAATALHDELAAARADAEEGKAALQASEAAHKRTVADAERRDELQLLTQQSQQALRSAFHRTSAAWWASRTSCLEDWSAARSHLLAKACSSLLATATREQREALEGAVARAATAHAAVTDQLQQQLSTVQHAAAVASERLQREEEAHHRTVAALTATQAATTVVQRSEAAQHARLLRTHAAWWSAQEACGLEWVAAKVDLLHRAYAVQQQQAWQSALVDAVERLTDSVERQTMASTPQVQRIESYSPPQRAGNHIVQRDDNGDEAYEAAEARGINQNASSRRSRSPDVMVMSLEDPLGLRYELQRKARRVRQLEAHVQQLEATHQADRQSLATLQALRQQESVDTRSPPPSTAAAAAAAAAVPYGKQAWSPSSTPLRQQRTATAASPPYRAPSQTWENTKQSNAPLSPSPSGKVGEGAGRRRWTPSEYQQRFAGT